MGRRKRQPDPQTPEEVLLDKINDLKREFSLSKSKGPTTIHAVNVEDYTDPVTGTVKNAYIDPVQGEVVYDWPNNRVCVWHGEKWWCTSMTWKKNRHVNDGTDSYVVSTTPAEYGGHFISNPTAAFMYVHLHDKATAPIAGDTPAMTLGIPPESSANMEYEGGIEFLVGLSVGVSTSETGGITGVSTGVVNILYDN